MSKYHISKHGVPAICKAREGNCPLGNSESHFESEDEAEEFIYKKNSSRYGLVPSMKEKHVPEERRVDLYHATSSQALERIMSGGSLSPPGESGVTSNGLGFDESAESGGVYLADSDDTVSIYLDGAVDNANFDRDLPNCGVVIELYADSDNLIADKDDFKGEDKETASWEDSLEDCNQVVHNGEIQAGQVKSVTFKPPFEAGGHLLANKKSMSDIISIRKGVLTGNKLSLEEAQETLNDMNESVRSQFAIQ